MKNLVLAFRNLSGRRRPPVPLIALLMPVLVFVNKVVGIIHELRNGLLGWHTTALVEKSRLLFFVYAIAAYAEKIQSVRQYSKPGLAGDLLLHAL